MNDFFDQKTTTQHGIVADAHELEKETLDLEKFRLSQDFTNLIGVEKALLTIPVRRPNRQDFVRVRPGEDWYLQTTVLEDSVDGETYLIDPPLRSELLGEIIPKVLFTAINRQGILFLWPIRLPGEDGRQNNWSRSALKAAEMAKSRWIRLVPNRSLGEYETYQATGPLPGPEWPDVSFREIITVAFRDKFINRMDHPFLRRLRGEL